MLLRNCVFSKISAKKICVLSNSTVQVAIIFQDTKFFRKENRRYSLLIPNIYANFATKYKS